MTCPDLMTLSQFLDGELTNMEETPVHPHVDDCPDCRVRVGRLQRALRSARVAIPAPPTDLPSATADCLGPEQIAAYVQHVLPPAVVPTVAAHLEQCDACLGEVIGAARATLALDAGPDLVVPPALMARVAARFGAAEPEPERLSALVVRVARAGLALVERHVVAPIVAMDEIATPAMATRAGEETTPLSFRIRAPGGQIHATLMPQHEGVGLALTLFDAADLGFAGLRVFVRRQGRSIFSARSDAGGMLRIPRLEPGIYEISCPSMSTAFRLDLRA